MMQEIPICIQTFRIVRARDDAGNPGFVAEWNHGPRQMAGLLGKNKRACPVRETRALVRNSMATLYRDVAEYGKEREHE